MGLNLTEMISEITNETHYFALINQLFASYTYTPLEITDLFIEEKKKIYHPWVTPCTQLE